MNSEVTVEPALKVTPQEYAEFIKQIELREIRLQRLEVENHWGSIAPERIEIAIDDDATYETTDSGFLVTHAYNAEAMGSGRIAFELEAIFKLDFLSDSPLTPEVFGIFSEANLPLNTWPYLRELVATSTGRMGWQPVTLPALKRGLGQDRSEPNSRSHKTKPERPPRKTGAKVRSTA